LGKRDDVDRHDTVCGGKLKPSGGNPRTAGALSTRVAAASYCSISHAEFLRRVTLDDALAQQLSADHRKAPITEAERVMVEYAVQITRDATRITPGDHVRLREVGFDDVGILQITMIASWFNYINRMADALGVGRD
jgi:uncharacterized peroxidase-related enzyme